VTGKRSPIHISIYAGLSIMGATAILYGTHLLTDLDISTQSTTPYTGYSNVISLLKELSIDFFAASKTYDRIKESQNDGMCLTARKRLI